MNEETNSIYTAIPAIIRDIRPIGKDHKSPVGYKFRTIDDIYGALAPQLADKCVTIIPQVEDLREEQHVNDKGRIQWRSLMTVRYRIVARDGSHLEAVIPAEAMDSSDKSRYQAFSMAFKYMCFQVFCMRIEGMSDDVEFRNPEAVAKPRQEPAQDKPAGTVSLRRQRFLSYLMPKQNEACKHFGVDSIEDIPDEKLPANREELARTLKEIPGWEGWWKDVIVPIPPKGMKRDDYMANNPPTLGELAKKDNSRFVGFIKNWRAKEYMGKPPSAGDLLFDRALDAAAIDENMERAPVE